MSRVRAQEEGGFPPLACPLEEDRYPSVWTRLFKDAGLKANEAHTTEVRGAQADEPIPDAQLRLPWESHDWIAPRVLGGGHLHRRSCRVAEYRLDAQAEADRPEWHQDQDQHPIQRSQPSQHPRPR